MISQSILLLAASSAALLTSSCYEIDLGLGGDGFSGGDEDVVTALRAATTLYDVGIIPDTPDCPHESELIHIYMDDEDKNNKNHTWGYTGAIVNDKNTRFSFCRLDGRQLKPLTSTPDPRRYYAVLQLGPYCPTGSTSFSRHFDNEDDDNKNSSSASFGSSIFPNVSNRNTTLYFCLFTHGSDTMASFPDIGIGYGVLAASDFLGDLGKGAIDIDDEDKDNKNKYDVPDSIRDDAQRIVSSGRNTTMSFAKVR
ncbi:hypothetical protein WMF11_25995 [Sorangium sp. So ce295]|jgi:hypothetical protein|uniref:hypothetical protein n=1 Tax=Sorangium sp. So ce295 TaxID=3133295 RepID=UPI003F62F4CD